MLHLVVPICLYSNWLFYACLLDVRIAMIVAMLRYVSCVVTLFIHAFYCYA